MSKFLRPVAGEIGRAVLDHRFLRDQPFLEGEAIDERLQRRAGRAQRSRHVDPAGAAGVEIVGRADLAEDFAGHASASTMATETRGPSSARGLARHRFQPFLHALADASAGASSRRAGCAARPRRHGRRARAGRRRTAEHVVKRCARGLALAEQARRRPCAPARGRARPRAPAGLRSGRRVSGNCGSATSRAASDTVEPLRLLAEIGERGGAHAFEIAAIGRERQVAFEDFGLATAAARSARRGRSGAVSGRCCGSRAARSAGRAASTASSRRRRCGHWRRTGRRRGRAPARSTPAWSQKRLSS